MRQFEAMPLRPPLPRLLLVALLGFLGLVGCGLSCPPAKPAAAAPVLLQCQPTAPGAGTRAHAAFALPPPCSKATAGGMGELRDGRAYAGEQATAKQSDGSPLAAAPSQSMSTSRPCEPEATSQLAGGGDGRAVGLEWSKVGAWVVWQSAGRTITTCVRGVGGARGKVDGEKKKQFKHGSRGKQRAAASSSTPALGREVMVLHVASSLFCAMGG